MGIFDPKLFEEIPDEDWFNFFETNVMSGVRLTRSYLPAMKARNWGRVVFISSESGVPPAGRDGALRHDQGRPACPSPAALPKPAPAPASPSIPYFPARPVPKVSRRSWPAGRRTGRHGEEAERAFANARPTRSSSASSTPPRSPPWSPMSAVRCPPPPRAQPSGRGRRSPQHGLTPASQQENKTMS